MHWLLFGGHHMHGISAAWNSSGGIKPLRIKLICASVSMSTEAIGFAASDRNVMAWMRKCSSFIPGALITKVADGLPSPSVETLNGTDESLLLQSSMGALTCVVSL